jgi:hypothetical protein
VGGKLIDKLIPDPEAKAKAQFELQKMVQDGELARMANETKLFEVEQENVTRRVEADMASDSWLSKNIRPMTLIFLLVAYSGFAIASIFELVDRSHVNKNPSKYGKDPTQSWK